MRGADALTELKARGKAGLARALADLEARPLAKDVTALLDAAFASPRGIALGLTGPPGVGKSTLSDALIRHWRGHGKTVGVIAVDPSSARSGGALLGDRTRMATDPADQGVFLRSMAARDRLGGIAQITFPAMVLMRAVFDRVIIETVGVGQTETAVADICDLTVLCAQPASGDAVQFLKAGIMEVPDILAVTKADLGSYASRMVADLKGALSVTSGRSGGPAVLACSAAEGAGIAELVAEIEKRGGPSIAGRRSSHENQLAAWSRAEITERFGRAGLAALGAGSQAVRADAPFTAAANRVRALDKAMQTALRNLAPLA